MKDSQKAVRSADGADGARETLTLQPLRVYFVLLLSIRVGQ